MQKGKRAWKRQGRHGRQSRHGKHGKRADSLLISYVLLIGFSAVLAAVVTLWYRSQAESYTETVTEKTEEDIRCNEVSINVKLSCPSSFTVTNRGYFTISKVMLRQISYNSEVDVNIKPSETSPPKPLNIQNPSESFDIFPIIQIDGQEVICPNRKITLQC